MAVFSWLQIFTSRAPSQELDIKTYAPFLSPCVLLYLLYRSLLRDLFIESLHQPD